MSFAARHVAFRILQGLKAYADNPAFWAASLDGLISTDPTDGAAALHASLFPSGRERVSVRTNYVGQIDSTMPARPGAARQNANFPAIIIDVVDDRPNYQMGAKLVRYDLTLEIMITGDRPLEVSALTVAVQDTLNTSGAWFSTVLGYSKPPLQESGGDIRPPDSAMLPGLLGQFSHYQRWSATLVRRPTSPFGEAETLPYKISVHHGDSKGEDGELGLVWPSDGLE